MAAAAASDGDLAVVVAEDKAALAAAGFTEDALDRPYHLVIPNGVTKIEARAFTNCSGLTSVTLPDGLTTIGNSAFYDCGGLTSVTLPDGLTRIDDCAFSGCSGLTSVTMPNGVVKMGEDVFAHCKWLVVVTLPQSLQPLETPSSSGVLGNCPRLSFVVAPSCVHNDVERHFPNCPILGPLQEHTPRSRLQALKLQCWSVATHRLCSSPRREWVVTVMLVAQRVGSQDSDQPSLPVEMWLTILDFVPRWALGPHHG